MAILVRETRVIDGQEFKDVKVFRSDKLPISPEEERKAVELDKYLAEAFAAMVIEARETNLLQLKGRAGVLPLWYFVGQKLRFIDDPWLVNPGEKKYIWKALWYHAGELVPGEPKSRSGTQKDHFQYCYRLAKYEKNFVANAGNWSSWQEFFDSPILSNQVFLEWFESKVPEIQSKNLKNWLRDFIKPVRQNFQNIDMSFLTSKEIKDQLDSILVAFISRYNEGQPK
jgi:hypothetical protein